MKTTFPGKLTKILGDYDLGKLDMPSLSTSDITDAVLADPDLVKLREWLRHESRSDTDNFGSPPGYAMRSWNLSEEFISWVLA